MALATIGPEVYLPLLHPLSMHVVPRLTLTLTLNPHSNPIPKPNPNPKVYLPLLAFAGGFPTTVRK